MGHGIWVGMAPMTDEHIILTENGVQKARSLHRVPPEERFVISELKKVRGLPWNGRAENLKATIVTQQTKAHLDIDVCYLTRVVARHGATPGCSGCVGLGPHTQKPAECDWKRHWPTREQILSKRQLDRSLSLPPSPQESAPEAQQEPASSSSGPAAPMPIQNFQNEQMDSPMELGPQERRERKGARPSETPTSEISGRPVVKARPASSPMIVPTATLVAEEDVWQFEATETYTTETQMQDGEQESIAVVDYAHDARTGENARRRIRNAIDTSKKIGLKHERTQTVQQHDVDCVPRK